MIKEINDLRDIINYRKIFIERALHSEPEVGKQYLLPTDTDFFGEKLNI